MTRGSKTSPPTGGTQSSQDHLLNNFPTNLKCHLSNILNAPQCLALLLYFQLKDCILGCHLTRFSVPCIFFKLVVTSGGLLSCRCDSLGRHLMNAASSSIAPHRGCTVTITVMSVLSTGLGAVISVREPPCQPLVVFQGHCSGHKLEKRLAYTEVWVYDTQVSQSDPAPRDDDHDWAPEQQAVTWREYQ